MSRVDNMFDDGIAGVQWAIEFNERLAKTFGERAIGHRQRAERLKVELDELLAAREKVNE